MACDRKCCYILHYLHSTDFENTTARIENFQEVTTVNERAQNVVVFSFDIFTSDFNNRIADVNSGIFQLRWETADNSSSGLVTHTVAKDHDFMQANHTTEGAATYHFTVDARSLGDGPLLLTLTIKLQCFHYSSCYCNQNPHPWCTCSQWQYEAESETILISAKKGNPSSHHVQVSHLQLIILGAGTGTSSLL